MVAFDLRWDKKLRRAIGLERPLDTCPAGHTAVQSPSWRGCTEGGHRIWTCWEPGCWQVTEDPDCPCQGGAGSTWGGRPISTVIAEITGSG